MPADTETGKIGLAEAPSWTTTLLSEAGTVGSRKLEEDVLRRVDILPLFNVVISRYAVAALHCR